MKTLAVTSGKGGVGKTNFSANLAIRIAAKGHRVLVFDADIGLANLDVVLGVPSPFKIQHALSGERRLAEIVNVGPGGIDFIAGGSGIESLVKLDGPVGDNFLAQLNLLTEGYDYLIFDTGAGIDGNVMTFLMAADDVILLATPDPASLTDAYATAKACLVHRPDANIHVVMNMVENDSQGRQVFAKLTSVTQQFLNLALKYAGPIRMDPGVLTYIRSRTPFTIGNPELGASQDVDALAMYFMGQAVPLRVVTGSGGKEISLVDRLKKWISFQRSA